MYHKIAVHKTLSQSRHLRKRRLLVEMLEQRRLFNVDWRNPVDAIDIDNDGTISPLDALVDINYINANGSGPLSTKRGASLPFYDVDGDQSVSPLDVLNVINYLNANGNGQRGLREIPGQLADETSITVTLGQFSGTRNYRVRIDTHFDTADRSAVVEDLVAVYLVDPLHPTTTLIDRGTNGTALFTLAGDKAELVPGRVRWDGSILDIDLSDLASNETGLLKFQLLNNDSDSQSTVTISPLTNQANLDGTVSPRFPNGNSPVGAGDPLTLSNLAPITSSQLEVSNVRFDSSTGSYVAEVSLNNLGDAIGRDVAVVFPGLPAGVTLRNRSGITTAGAPYINLKPAIQRGGLPHNARSQPVVVEFDNPGRLSFLLKPAVLASQNHAPVIAPIAPLTVMPGSVFSASLAATDADGDSVQFSLVSTDQSVALPTGSLSSSGVLDFRPTPSQLGVYQFDVIASDGTLGATRPVTLNVVTDPITTTRVSGKVLKLNGQPLASMPIQIGAVQGLTLADGSFTLDLGSGTVVSDTIKVHGEQFRGASVYPFIAEKLAFILEHDVYTHYNNVIDRPIYLPELDVAGGKAVDPMRDTSVKQEIAPGEMAEVFVAAGTLMNQQGSPFTGTLSITEVPPGLTPAALPEGMNPDLVVTIQPGEMVFVRPAPLSLPNRSGFAPGIVMDLWSINPVTGEFEDVGDAQVSADGKTIDTISGGVRNSSWHYVSNPGQSSPERGKKRTGKQGCNACAYDSEASSRVEQYSGTIIESHDLPTYQSQGVSRGVQLVYDSVRADPRPIIHFGIENFAGAGAVFPFLSNAVKYAAKVTINRNDFHYTVPGTPSRDLKVQNNLGDDYNFWQAPVTSGPADAAVQVDLRQQPSGVYSYQVRSGMFFVRPPEPCSGSGNICTPPPPTLVGTTEIYSDPLVFVNEIASPFGAGWGIVGLQRLIHEADRTVMIVDGDGSELVFNFDAQLNKYIAPPGDFSSLERLGDGRFRRTMPDQLVYQFDVDGRLLSETDRNQNKTVYAYDAQGRLTTITDPVNLVTLFAYTGSKLSSITDPANRQTRFEHDAQGNLTRITDPDGTSRTWGYDADHHIVSEVDKLGRRETTEYGTHGRATGGVHKDGSFYTIRAPQTEALSPPDATLGLDAKATLFSLSEKATAQSIDGNGNVQSAELDPAGQPEHVTDTLGAMPSVQRGDGNLPIATTDARGFVVKNTFDGRGNLLTTRDSLSIRVGDEPGIIGLMQGTIQYSGEVDHYSFFGKDGELLYIDSIHGNIGASVFRTDDLSQSSGVGGSLSDGEYRVDVSTGFSTGAYTVQLLSLGQSPRLQLGTTSGSAAAGQDFAYRISLQRDQRLRIAETDRFGEQLWYVQGLDGSYYSFAADYGTSTYEFIAPSDGEYVIIRRAPAANSLDLVPYSFTASVATPSQLVPKVGFGATHSGTLQIGEEQTFRFTAPVGKMVYIDRHVLADSNRDFATLTLIDASGATLTSIFNQGGLIRLNDSGEFRLVASNASQFGPTDFSFRILDLAAAKSVAVGDSLDGIMAKGEAAIYKLTGAPGQRIISHTFTGDFSNTFTKQLVTDRDPISRQLAENQVLVIAEDTEQFLLFDASDVAQSFHWRSLDARQSKPLALDRDLRGTFTVGDDRKYFRFTAQPGTVLFNEKLESNITRGAIFDEQGEIWNGTFYDKFQIPLHSLTFPPESSHEYFLVASMEEQIFLPHDFGFRLHSLQSSSSKIQVGQTAIGKLDWVESDAYTFEGRAGQWLYYDARHSQANLDSTVVGATITGPHDSSVNAGIGYATDSGPFQLTETGTYQIALQSTPVNDQSVLHRDYQFRLFDMNETPLANFLSPLERPLQNGAALEIYRFAASSGQRVTFSQSAPAATTVRVFTKRGELLRDAANDASLTMTFGETATYYLVVSARDQSVTTPVASRWTITDGAEPAVTPAGFNTLHDGLAIEDEIVATFTANAGTRILFEGGADTQFSDYVYLRVLGPSGESIADLAPSGSRFLFLPRSGTYTLQAHGDPYTLNTPTRYRFRLQQVGDLPILEPGTLQTISPSSEADLGVAFQVQGAGKKVWVDLIQPDDHNELIFNNPPKVFSTTFDVARADGFPQSVAGYNDRMITIPGGSPLVVGARTELNVDSLLRVVDIATVPRLNLGVESTGSMARVHDDMLWRFTASAGEKRLFQVDSRYYMLVDSADPQSYIRLDLPSSPREIVPGVFAFEAVVTFPKAGEYLLVRRGVFGQSRDFAATMSSFVETSQPLVAAVLSKTSFTYEAAFNQMTSMVDEQQRQTLFDIDPATGNVRSATKVIGAVGGPDDLVSRFTYTPSGQIDTANDPLGRIMDYDYDLQGRVTTITAVKGTPLQTTQHFEYDAAGNMTASIDANGHKSTFEYDAMNRRTTITEPDPDGAGPLLAPVTQFTYDTAGNVKTLTDAAGHVSSQVYDTRDRMVAATDANQQVTRYGYDQNGNVISSTDPLGRVTRMRYDARNRMIASVDPAGFETRYSYDLDNNLTSLTDASGNVTRYEYDARKRRVAEIDPFGKFTSYAYSGVNEVVAKTDRLGRTTRFDFDDVGRLIHERWIDTANTTVNTVDYQYDAASRLVRMQDATTDIRVTFDVLDRATRSESGGVAGVPVAVLDATYDAIGNRLTLTDTIQGNLGATNTYLYDALDRLTRQTQSTASGSTNSTAEKRVDFAYNILSQTTSIARYGDLAGTKPIATSQFTYDTLNRVTNIAHRNSSNSLLDGFAFTYDATSRITRITDNDGVTDYSHDTRDQLTGANHADVANPDETYAYDATGNRTSSHRHGSGYSTGVGNRLNSDGTNSYEYDAEGNLIKQTTIATSAVREFRWDHRNRLIRVTDRPSAAAEPTQIVEFVYDARNRRLAKTVGNSTIYFIDDGDNVLLELTDPDGNGPKPAVKTMRYLHGPNVDQILAQENAAGVTQWLLTDLLGTTRDLVNSDGSVANHLRYDSFGNLISQANSAQVTRYLYTGREYEAELSLQYSRARYYDAQHGRFISEDSIGLAGGLNLFAYVENSPLGARDPSGHEKAPVPSDRKTEPWWKPEYEQVPEGSSQGPTISEQTKNNFNAFGRWLQEFFAALKCGIESQLQSLQEFGQREYERWNDDKRLIHLNNARALQGKPALKSLPQGKTNQGEYSPKPVMQSIQQPQFNNIENDPSAQDVPH